MTVSLFLLYTGSVGDAVAEGAVLVLDRLCAAGIVDDSQVGILLAGCETHEPPAVVADVLGHRRGGAP